MASWNFQSMPNCAATGWNAALSPSWVTPSTTGWQTTRMKKRPVSTSSYWADSRMLQPWLARSVATAATMPGRSVQERVRMVRIGFGPR